MTITTNDARNEFTATAAQTVFNYTFKIYSNSDLNVYVTPTGQVADDTADLVTTYTVDPGTIGDEAGGFITMDSGITAGYLVTIVSDIAESRTTDYQTNGDFIPPTVNDDFDRVVSIVKQLSDGVDRNLKVQQSEQGVTSITLPPVAIDECIKWNAAGDGLDTSPFVETVTGGGTGTSILNTAGSGDVVTKSIAVQGGGTITDDGETVTIDTTGDGVGTETLTAITGTLSMTAYAGTDYLLTGKRVPHNRGDSSWCAIIGNDITFMSVDNNSILSPYEFYGRPGGNVGVTNEGMEKVTYPYLNAMAQLMGVGTDIEYVETLTMDENYHLWTTHHSSDYVSKFTGADATSFGSNLPTYTYADKTDVSSVISSYASNAWSSITYDATKSYIWIHDDNTVYAFTISGDLLVDASTSVDLSTFLPASYVVREAQCINNDLWVMIYNSSSDEFKVLRLSRSGGEWDTLEETISLFGGGSSSLTRGSRITSYASERYVISGAHLCKFLDMTSGLHDYQVVTLTNIGKLFAIGDKVNGTDNEVISVIDDDNIIIDNDDISAGSQTVTRITATGEMPQATSLGKFVYRSETQKHYTQTANAEW